MFVHACITLFTPGELSQSVYAMLRNLQLKDRHSLKLESGRDIAYYLPDNTCPPTDATGGTVPNGPIAGHPLYQTYTPKPPQLSPYGKDIVDGEVLSFLD